MTSQNRCKNLTAAETRELLSTPKDLAEANARHDAKYGADYEKCSWKSAYQPACPRRDPESIFEWHRKIDDAKAMNLGLRIG